MSHILMAVRPVSLSALPDLRANFQKFPEQTLGEHFGASYSRTKYMWICMDCKQPTSIWKHPRKYNLSGGLITSDKPGHSGGASGGPKFK
jgi:hypothetical protein